jgi:hypothetical protein
MAMVGLILLFSFSLLALFLLRLLPLLLHHRNRVPKEMKGPLDTFWKVRDSQGFVTNYDGTRSACVHQWDRWFDELHAFVDANVF